MIEGSFQKNDHITTEHSQIDHPLLIHVTSQLITYADSSNPIIEHVLKVRETASNVRRQYLIPMSP